MRNVLNFKWKWENGYQMVFLINEPNKKIKIVLRILNKIYPKTPIPLKHKNTFTLLVSVALSAQTTDLNVNNVTKNIYKNIINLNIL